MKLLLAVVLSVALLSGVVFAQEPDSSRALEPALSSIGNNLSFLSVAITNGLKYLGHCVLAGSVILALSVVISGRKK